MHIYVTASLFGAGSAFTVCFIIFWIKIVVDNYNKIEYSKVFKDARLIRRTIEFYVKNTEENILQIERKRNLTPVEKKTKSNKLSKHLIILQTINKQVAVMYPSNREREQLCRKRKQEKRAQRKKWFNQIKNNLHLRLNKSLPKT